MRSIEFACLLAGIGCKIAYQIFIYIAQHVIVLRTVGRNIPDQLDEVFQGAGLIRRSKEFSATDISATVKVLLGCSHVEKRFLYSMK